MEIAIEKLQQNAAAYGVGETNAETEEPLEAQFEVNLPTEKLQSLLSYIFSGWYILKTGVTAQEYDIPRDEITSHLDTHVVTYVAQRRISHD